MTWADFLRKTIELLRDLKDSHKKTSNYYGNWKLTVLKCDTVERDFESLEKPCVFEGQDDGLRCERTAQPRATWG